MASKIGWLCALACGGCVVAATSHHENAFPERHSGSFGWGLIELGRNYKDAWQADPGDDPDDLVVGPLATLSGSYAPVPRLKLGVTTYGSGVGFTGKAVVGSTEHWAAAVVGTAGFLAGDDSDTGSGTTWEASGFHTNTSAVLSRGWEFDVGKRKDFFATLSGGPKVVTAHLTYERTDGSYEWNGNVIDYGGFVGGSLERRWFRGSIEFSMLSLDRPSAGERVLRPNFGMKIAFSW